MMYSTDNGSTWQRTENIPVTDDYTCSSEDEIVELEDGTLRMFFRAAVIGTCWNSGICRYRKTA